MGYLGATKAYRLWNIKKKKDYCNSEFQDDYFPFHDKTKDKGPLAITLQIENELDEELELGRKRNEEIIIPSDNEEENENSEAANENNEDKNERNEEVRRSRREPKNLSLL